MTREFAWAYFGDVELSIPLAACADMPQCGPADDCVALWAPRIERPESLTVERLRRACSEYGAWDDEQLSDDGANWERCVWLTIMHVKEEIAAHESGDCEDTCQFCEGDA